MLEVCILHNLIWLEFCWEDNKQQEKLSCWRTSQNQHSAKCSSQIMPPVINDFPKNKPTLASRLAPLARQQLGSKGSVTSPVSWHDSSGALRVGLCQIDAAHSPVLLAASSHLMATDEDALHRLLGPHWELKDSPHLQSSHLVTLLALPPVLQEDNEVSRGADSSRWIMEIKLCVCAW